MPSAVGLGLVMWFLERVIMGWEEEWERRGLEANSGGEEFSGVVEVFGAGAGGRLRIDAGYGLVLLVEVGSGCVWWLGSVMGSVWGVSKARVCGAGAGEDANRDLGYE